METDNMYIQNNSSNSSHSNNRDKPWNEPNSPLRLETKNVGVKTGMDTAVKNMAAAKTFETLEEAVAAYNAVVERLIEDRVRDYADLLREQGEKTLAEFEESHRQRMTDERANLERHNRACVRTYEERLRSEFVTAVVGKPY